MPNVRGQRTRHLVEGTLDPLVGLFVFQCPPTAALISRPEYINRNIQSDAIRADSNAITINRHRGDLLVMILRLAVNTNAYVNIIHGHNAQRPPIGRTWTWYAWMRTIGTRLPHAASIFRAIILIILFLMPNVTGQRTRHLVAGTLDPIVRLIIIPLFGGDKTRRMRWMRIEKAKVRYPMRTHQLKARALWW